MTPFIRDRFTWLTYFMLAYFAYLQAALGPLMPFLRAQLDLSYTVAAFHVSAFAIGMILAGLTGDRLARRWGRRTVFWFGGAGMALGGVLLTLTHSAPLTIASVFVMGYIGSYVLVIIPASLSDRHGVRRAVALTESNVAASVASVCAPLLIGVGEASGLGWRAAIIVGVGIFFALYLAARRIAFPAPKAEAKAGTTRPLPLRFWAYWLVVLFSVAIEWCMVFWGADFLVNSVGLERVAAATLMSLFLIGMVIGRFVGSRLTRTIESSRLLIYAVAVVLVGFPLFWLAKVPVVNIVGLFLTGLGIANLFPLTLSVATGIDPQQSNTAAARISLAGGTAILVAPQVLASIADRAGIHNAFGVAAIMLVAAAILIAAARGMAVPADATT